MTPEDAERVVTVARAALAEVGGDPERVFLYEVGRPVSKHDDGRAWRALRLGAMAVCGPDHMVRCLPCSPVDLGRPPCTPVRDVLAGHTCQHERTPT